METYPPLAVEPPPQGISVAGSSATCQAPDSQEADGTPIRFDPGNVVDGDPVTAWRCAAPATGQTLTINYSAPVHLTSVGMIPGYRKVDRLTGVDRWGQNYRVQSVRWTFSDGTTVVDQQFTDTPTMQTTPVDVTTTSVTFEITATYEPTFDASTRKDFVPVAEVQITGTAA